MAKRRAVMDLCREVRDGVGWTSGARPSTGIPHTRQSRGGRARSSADLVLTDPVQRRVRTANYLTFPRPDPIVAAWPNSTLPRPTTTGSTRPGGSSRAH